MEVEVSQLMVLPSWWQRVLMAVQQGTEGGSVLEGLHVPGYALFLDLL